MVKINKKLINDTYACLIRKSNQIITMTENWQWRNINMDAPWQWNGGSYLINDGNGLSISIGANVTEIEVYGWLAYISVDTDSMLEVHILKNGEPTGIASFAKVTNGGTQTILIPSLRMSVAEGDKISLGIISSSLRSITVYSDDVKPATGFAIKVIQ